MMRRHNILDETILLVNWPSFSKGENKVSVLLWYSSFGHSNSVQSANDTGNGLESTRVELTTCRVNHVSSWLVCGVDFSQVDTRVNSTRVDSCEKSKMQCNKRVALALHKTTFMITPCQINPPRNWPDVAVPSRIRPATKVFEQSCPETDSLNYFSLA